MIFIDFTKRTINVLHTAVTPHIIYAKLSQKSKKLQH